MTLQVVLAAAIALLPAKESTMERNVSVTACNADIEIIGGDESPYMWLKVDQGEDHVAALLKFEQVLELIIAMQSRIVECAEKSVADRAMAVCVLDDIADGSQDRKSRSAERVLKSLRPDH